MFSVRPFTPSFYSFSFETTKDTAGCRAFYRNFIVGGFFQEGREYFVGDDEYELPLAEFHGLTRTFHPNILTIEHMLKWQQADGFLPKALVPFCSDQSGDSYFIEAGGGSNHWVYYIFHEEYDEFLNSFLENPEDCWKAKSFTDFLEKIHVR